MHSKILVVDDEKNILVVIKKALETDFDKITTVETAEKAIELLDKNQYDIVITDLKLPGLSGIDLLKTIREKNLDTDVIIITAFATTSSAIDALKLGAADYLQKPFNIDELRIVVNNILNTRALKEENITLKKQLFADIETSGIIGQSKSTKNILNLIGKISQTDVSVMITGESGTGKELVAKAIHQNSNRKNERFLSVNCAALPETLLESELFGVEKGAITGAINRKKGLFELAHNGTLFLDEIGEMPLPMQAKLLRVLQEFIIRRVGGTEDIKINVRLITATNRKIEEEVKKGKFREDLYYRINVFHIHIPPLRERKEDIPILTDYFLKKIATKHKRAVPTISKDAMKILENYDWPGNIRELENIIERILAFESDNIISSQSIPDFLSAPDNRQNRTISIPSSGLDIEEKLNEIRLSYMEHAMKQTNYNMTDAAKLLKMSFRSFRYYYHKLK
jgi:DNA-binding NtrC family response regulator